MDEKELNLIKEYSQTVERYNRRMYHVAMALILSVIVFASSFVFIVKTMSDDFTDATKSYWHDYMYSDYDYGSYEVNQEVKVND